jgi:uncharacterized protein
MPTVPIPVTGASVVCSGHFWHASSNFIFDETVILCLYRLYQVAARVGEVLLDQAVVDLVRITPEDEQRAWALWLARPDKTYSYTDCTSFVVMRRLGI